MAVTDNQTPSLDTVAEQQEAVLTLGVVWIVNQPRAFVQKNRLSLLERDSVLFLDSIELYVGPKQIGYCPQHYFSNIF